MSTAKEHRVIHQHNTCYINSLRLTPSPHTSQNSYIHLHTHHLSDSHPSLIAKCIPPVFQDGSSEVSNSSSPSSSLPSQAHSSQINLPAEHLAKSTMPFSSVFSRF